MKIENIYFLHQWITQEFNLIDDSNFENDDDFNIGNEGYGFSSGAGYGDNKGFGGGYSYNGNSFLPFLLINVDDEDSHPQNDLEEGDGSGSAEGRGYYFNLRDIDAKEDLWSMNNSELSKYCTGEALGDGIYYCKIWGDWFEISSSVENSLCSNIPEKHYDKITKEFVQKIDNLECLRELRDKIGLDRYIKLFDAKVIDEATDHQGNGMKLYRYKEKGKKVILLEVICPSTGRMYHLYPPKQKAKTCMQAKNSTFRNIPLAYRHGDVGLTNLLTNPSIPFSET